MSAQLTFLGNSVGPHEVVKRFSCQLAANYTNSGGAGNVGTPGETISFNTALNPKFAARPRIPAGPPAARLPLNTDIKCYLPQGYDAVVEMNAVAPTPNNYVLRIFTTSATELAAGAYPAALLLEPFLIEVRVPLRYV